MASRPTSLLPDGERFDEDGFEQQLESDPLLVLPAGRHWIRKLQARFYAEDYPAALAAGAKAAASVGITGFLSYGRVSFLWRARTGGVVPDCPIP